MSENKKKTFDFGDDLFNYSGTEYVSNDELEKEENANSSDSTKPVNTEKNEASEEINKKEEKESKLNKEIENSLKKRSKTKINFKKLDKKVLLIAWVLGSLLIILLVVLISSLFGSSKPSPEEIIARQKANSIKKQEQSMPSEANQLPVDDATLSWAVETSTWTQDSIVLEDSSQNLVEENNLEITEGNTSIDADSNNIIKVESNSSDETIDIMEAVLSPSTVKVSLDSHWEIKWFEEKSWEEASFVRVKENSLVIPTVSKSNFIPDVKLVVENSKTQYKVSDQIEVNYKVFLNSKSLSYTISKKTYKDRDLIIDINLNPINTSIVSIEENLKEEQFIIPLNLMTRGDHTVWFKLNGYPLNKFNFSVQ